MKLKYFRLAHTIEVILIFCARDFQHHIFKQQAPSKNVRVYELDKQAAPNSFGKGDEEMVRARKE